MNQKKHCLCVIFQCTVTVLNHTAQIHYGLLIMIMIKIALNSSVTNGILFHQKTLFSVENSFLLENPSQKIQIQLKQRCKVAGNGVSGEFSGGSSIHFTNPAIKVPCNKNKKEQKLQNISSQKSSKRREYPFNKVSILTSSSSGKSRWYLFLFGITRFPTEMELRDMKNRQSRRRRDPSPPMFHLKHDDEKINVGRSSGRGLWGLIKALSCGGGHQTNAVVAAPVSCIPPPSLKL
ncbi:hypothetical protein Fot_00255 [Forsythia ovata]|uniref:Uncharacterized protein n=1 Tax=Forsythia ovata TaxID=205694 RepID=A0ABD1X116_9LAMI